MKKQQQTSTEDLVLRAQQGDEDAFRTLYSRHSRYIAGVIYSIMGKDGEVDDLTQDAFVEAYLALSTIAEPTKFRQWMRTIAARCTYRSLRKSQRLITVSLFSVSLPIMDEREDDVLLREKLYTILDAMPPKIRIPWTLFSLEEMSLEEVAITCGISRSTAKRRIKKAAKRLEKRVRHE